MSRPTQSLFCIVVMEFNIISPTYLMSANSMDLSFLLTVQFFVVLILDRNNNLG